MPRQLFQWERKNDIGVYLYIYAYLINSSAKLYSVTIAVNPAGVETTIEGLNLILVYTSLLYSTFSINTR